MQKELLSAYIDGENVDNKLTDALCKDEDLQRSWANLHVIRTVMRQESQDIFLGADFTAKMENLIAAEVGYENQPTMEEAEKSPFMQKLRSWLMPVTQVAVAAGVCLVAVIGVQSFNNTEQGLTADSDKPVLQTLPFTNNVQAVSYNAPTKDVVTNEEVEQKNKRIEAMLQDYELQRRMHMDKK
ncbi:sigma-E factor negative regulatory protein [Conservatibacter flavescens]|uniref:Anti-sigma-E factor RseA n=1 Tax=Conservatibacter flavescens TaxID=28161 RepID=A0A2M8S1C0_9PAST|nr:sigma-E factor negative regulatory protein [Conservatibacter flavescens]PJG84918.1 transcriptional regulator [Conservatibacter flavescens]